MLCRLLQSPGKLTAINAQLANFDAFLFGIPTRYGNFPAQFKAFWDATGQLWAGGKLAGKSAGLFISTASPGGGQECTSLPPRLCYMYS